jgi:hypothetical protein
MMRIVDRHRGSRVQFERDALRLLCSERIEPGTRGQLAGMLKEYEFADGLNGAVYEAIAGMWAVPARRLRELLPGRVTNLGFPDFDLKEFLGRTAAMEQDIDKLFESLLKLAEEKAQQGEKAMGQSA